MAFPSDAFVQEMGIVTTDLGPALYVKVRREGYGPLSWRQAWEVFNDRYPGKWAAQFFPPADQLVDDEDIFHLYVIEFVPRGVNICRKGGN
jgi:hypothetical protein